MADGLEYASLPVGELATFGGNPRRGRVDVVAESLKVNGQYRPIVVNRGTLTGRPLEVLAGNHTLLAARSLGWGEIACALVDVDDEAARRIVAADNRTADLGGYDDEALFDLLSGLPDLAGTGFTHTELAALGELVDGAPDLDDLHDEVGDPTPEDGLTVVRLAVDTNLAAVWSAHRRSFDSDSAALRAAMNL